ncbi:MAG: sulfatase-like hydrolase/transferase, partial [Hyphomicrobiales bacterium]|nr:sulfatase-like hydrolase/transferase [Hyphomicrobiales bacterium]
APEECDEIRANYCAIVALCDAQMGRLLDYFDEHDLWKDTALVVSTDHGFLLGEHDWWAKLRMPVYNELANIPLFIHHPDHSSRAGARRKSLTQTIDLMPTMPDLHGVAVPSEVEGRSLLSLLDSDTPIREGALYGIFGSAANITDGRYTYFRYPEDLETQEIYEYTVMPTRITSFFTPEELSTAELAEPFGFTKGARTLKIRGHDNIPMYRGLGMGFFQDTGTVLFDTETDPNQMNPLDDPATEARLAALMKQMMEVNDAPPEAYVRFGMGDAVAAE